jgi:hypothetical protein
MWNERIVKEIDWEMFYYMYLAQSMEQWREAMDMVHENSGSMRVGKSLGKLSDFQLELCPNQFIIWNFPPCKLSWSRPRPQKKINLFFGFYYVESSKLPIQNDGSITEHIVINIIP